MTCASCIHFGTLKGRAGVTLGHICMAPITTEPPKDGVTRAKNPFVYEAEADGCCEMWTEKRCPWDSNGDGDCHKCFNRPGGCFT